MLIIPAIDLKNGKVVRLVRGEASQERIYGQDSVGMARRWVEAGAKRLHVVDLDGALTGSPKHTSAILEIAKAVSIPVQTGGGIRTLETIETYLSGGVDRVILGTQALLDETFVSQALEKHAERIAVAVDVKEGRVAVEGWVRKEGAEPRDFIQRLIARGVQTLIYTDTSRDGTLAGPALEPLREILKEVDQKSSFIASGGVSCVEDLVRLKELEPLGLTGVIVGRALYDGKVDLKQALAKVS